MKIDAAPEVQHILVVGNDPLTLVNFRGPLIEAMLRAGHKVTAVGGGRDPKLEEWFRQRDVAYLSIPLERAGLNPFKDMRTLLALVRAMRKHKPDLVFAYMIKPVVYGLLAAKISGVPRGTAMITGLGYAFTNNIDEGRLARAHRAVTRRIAWTAYATALSFADTVIFQNPDDRAEFAQLGLLRRVRKVALVNGSGIDLKHFSPAPMPSGPPVVLMIARLLRDKGVYDYVKAARLVRSERPDVRFVLAGPIDPNPSAVKPHEVEAWVRSGLVEYRGSVDDVRPLLASSHIFVLPSFYGEGVPRTILEAMATGRPVVTTDWRGCREAVSHGENGVLVPVRDAKALADGILALAADAATRERMGLRGLAIARQRYEAANVSQDTLSALAFERSDLPE